MGILKTLISAAVGTLLVVGAAWSQVAQAEDIESPSVLLERTSQQVIKLLQDDQELLKKEPDRVYAIIDEYILPHLDDVTMAKLALGKNWKKATKQQKIAFVGEFRNLLVRTYSKSLIEFSDQEILFFPVKLTADEFKNWEHKCITLLGMSGVGKTRLSAMLRGNSWFHYSGDYRIGTRYLDEPILDNIKQQAMQVPFLRDLLHTDSIYIANNLSVDNLKPVASFLGKLGNPEHGGLDLPEFKRRQSLHHQAEIADAPVRLFFGAQVIESPAASIPAAES